MWKTCNHKKRKHLFLQSAFRPVSHCVSSRVAYECNYLIRLFWCKGLWVRTSAKQSLFSGSHCGDTQLNPTERTSNCPLIKQNATKMWVSPLCSRDTRLVFNLLAEGVRLHRDKVKASCQCVALHCRPGLQCLFCFHSNPPTDFLYNQFRWEGSSARSQYKYTPQLLRS